MQGLQATRGKRSPVPDAQQLKSVFLIAVKRRAPAPQGNGAMPPAPFVNPAAGPVRIAPTLKAVWMTHARIINARQTPIALRVNSAENASVGNRNAKAIPTVPRAPGVTIDSAERLVKHPAMPTRTVVTGSAVPAMGFAMAVTVSSTAIARATNAATSTAAWIDRRTSTAFNSNAGSLNRSPVIMVPSHWGISAPVR